jgi:hypothetical protein
VDRAVSVVGLLCRTSDRTFAHARGVQALAPLLGDQVGVEARMIGSPGEPAENDWSEDLRLSRGCLLEAGGQVDDAFTAGSFPVIVGGDCSIAITTLPTVVRHVPDARIVWLDAHGDFNTPDTTPSGFLGGMGLSAAVRQVGRRPGRRRRRPGERVLCGVRDLDGQEQVLLETSGVRTVRPSQLADELDGEQVLRAPRPRRARPVRAPVAVPAHGGLSTAGCARCSASWQASRRSSASRSPRSRRPRTSTSARRSPRPSPRSSSRCCGERPLAAEGEVKTSLLRPLVDDLHERRAKARAGGGEERSPAARRRQAHRARAHRPARRRGTFVELGLHAQPHFSQQAMAGPRGARRRRVTGYGKVDGGWSRSPPTTSRSWPGRWA